METKTDTELMREVRTGRTSALATLFERHHARVYAYCLRMTGDRSVSEDLVQDVFMRMLKYRKSFKNSSELAPWMFSIARNACADYWRSSRRARNATSYVADGVEEPATPDDCVSDDERATLLHRALLALPFERREILLLSRFEFKKYEEIAAILGCSAAAARVRAHRAIKELREIYSDLSQEIPL